LIRFAVIRVWLVLVVLSGATTVSAQVRELPDFTRLAEEQAAAVVNISTMQAPRRSASIGQLPQVPGLEDEEVMEFFRRFIPRTPGVPREARSLGSGFVISNDGYILTNAHVVDGAEEINVRLTDKREFKARVIGADRRTDVALIKIEASNLPVVKVGNPSQLRVGEWVVAIGSPFGFESTVTAGIVSAKGRSLPQENFVPFIQTDVAINPGNSGGPLFNMRGEVVGINSQIYSRTGGFMGLSFAIPIDVALDIQSQLRDRGRVARGRIGVVIQEVTQDVATSFGLERPRGAMVTSVERGSPAEKAGVEALDIIVKFGGKAVDASGDLPRLVGGTRPGSEVSMEVLRKGSQKLLTVTVGELPEDRIAGRESGRSTPKPAAAANRLGIVVAELTQEQRAEARVTTGLYVLDVRQESRIDLRRGDILLTLVHEGRQIDLNGLDQFNRLLAGMGRDAVFTLHVKRGESTLLIPSSGFPEQKAAPR